MAIAKTDQTNQNFASASTSFSHVVSSGSDLVLVVFHFAETSTTVSSMTWDGTSMTEVTAAGGAGPGGARHGQTFYLLSPATGTKTLAKTVSGGGLHGTVALTYSGVSAVVNGTKVNGSAPDPSFSVVSATGDLVVALGHGGRSADLYEDAGQTELYYETPWSEGISVCSKDGATSTTLSWTAADWVPGLYGVSLTAAGAAAGQPIRLRSGGIPGMQGRWT